MHLQLYLIVQISLVFKFDIVFLHSVEGKMDDPETCKVYGYLISTLNSSFPDYDFR